MTDIPNAYASVPGRLGVAARFEDGEFSMLLFPQPEVLHHGMVRASVISYVIDAFGSPSRMPASRRIAIVASSER